MNTILQQRVERFKTYNASRMLRATSFDPAKAEVFFRVVPFLLHANHPGLPGFVEDKACPYGIHGFDPKVLNPMSFRRLFPSSSALGSHTQNPFSQNPCIQSLKTIGSIGTIAQTGLSDCDYWVSVRSEELGVDGLKLLEQKCTQIEDWCLKKGIEVHFFLMDVDQTRENSFDSKADKESAGSALKVLLKDELFRTSILVAGKMLLWWIIPPGFSDIQYHDYVTRLIAEQRIDPKEFVDLGYLSGIPRSEIFGACLWQMNKALDSPFKSVIKFAYLELLLDDTSKKLPVFSDLVKCLVTFPELLADQNQEILDLIDVDPYLLLARSLVSFYQEKKRQDDADFIRECLFLKTIEGMESQKRWRDQADNLATVTNLMQNWDLLPGQLQHFRNFKAWPYKELIKFGAKVHAYLSNTYNRLRVIFQNLAGQETLTITERDIAVLGRKLFAFYEKKNDKLEYIKSPSREVMRQQDLTLLITKIEGQLAFYAFQGQHERRAIKDAMGFVIKRDDDLVSLLAWLLINGIVADCTRLHLISDYSYAALVDIQSLADSMVQFFPRPRFAHIATDRLLQPEVTTRAMLVVNFAKESVKGSKILRSSLITTNSYGEFFVRHFTTLAQLKHATHTLLAKYYVSRWNKNLEIFIPPQPEAKLIQSLIES